ncbi:MAG: hypothetical protein JXB13_11940 [Phycisphaerae bacterium]|nr:hypothetical protein [Phycisphaerae bacterium]
MYSKRSLIVLLAGVNIVLLAALVFSVASPPAAIAQVAPGRPGDFMMATGSVTNQLDAVFIIDSPGRLLHCFLPAQNKSGQLMHAQTRSLANDFRSR